MRGLRWTVLARPVVEVFLLASMVVLARLVPPADFGRYAVALVVLELLLVPATAVGTALVQRPNAGERKYMQTGYALTLLSGVGLIALTLTAAKVLIEPIFDHQTGRHGAAVRGRLRDQHDRHRSRRRCSNVAWRFGS